MKQHIIDLLSSALLVLREQQIIPVEITPALELSKPRDPSHGDFASNLALLLAKPAGINPRVMAEQIMSAIPKSSQIEKIEIAGPGFINFFVTQSSMQGVISKVLQQGQKYGHSQIGAGKKTQVEFVSANPNGPLHVGHGRGAAFGATLANILDATGFDVQREYYVNDAGRQMDILSVSVWLRYLQMLGLQLDFPSNGYRGDYVLDIAQQLRDKFSNTLRTTTGELFANVPDDEPKGGDKDAHIDALIEQAKNILGKASYAELFQLALDSQLKNIHDDLEEFGVTFDRWFSEKSITDSGDIQRAIGTLQANDAVYGKDGAIWFRSSQYGDDKDRVMIRENGQTTYFASDIAYVLNKLERGFERIIYVWGSDHHGYIPRMLAVAQALKADHERLHILLVQFVVLFRGGVKQQMSTRSGDFITLRELRTEVGNDAARFFYVMRNCDQHLDFDLDLAKSSNKDNPVYYIQYAHARICSVFRQLSEKTQTYNQEMGLENLQRLDLDHETDLMKMLAQYPDTINSAASKEQPHLVCNYLRELATSFHVYYNEHKFLLEDEPLRNARLTLCKAVQQVLLNGLQLVGVSAPEEM